MGTYQTTADGEVYTVIDAGTSVYWAVITGAASDEIFGTLNAPGFAVELTRSDLGAKAYGNGLYAITGYPGQSFPQLATTSYTVSYTLTAPGYRDFPMSVTIPTGTTVFPVGASASAMRLLPVTVQGRVVSGTTRLPIGGAAIASIDNPSAPPTVHVTALRSPLYCAHAAGAAAQPVIIATTGSATLTAAVTGGDQMLNLSDRTGLAAGSIVRLTYAVGVWVEYGVVASLGPGPASASGQVFLTNALNSSYPTAGTVVDFVSATPSGGGATLSSDADAGDGVLLASQLFSQTVALETGTPQYEIHEIGAISGGDGYYILAGIGRVQEIFLQATSGASNQTANWFLEYDQALNTVNFQL